MFGKSNLQKAKEMEEQVSARDGNEACENFSKKEQAVELLHDDNPEVREYAAKALSRVAHRNKKASRNVFGVEEDVVAHFDDTNEEVRRRSVKTVGSIGLTDVSRVIEYLPELAEKLEDPSESVGYEAALALQGIAQHQREAVAEYRRKLQQVPDSHSGKGPAEHTIEILDATIVKKCTECATTVTNTDDEYCSICDSTLKILYEESTETIPTGSATTEEDHGNSAKSNPDTEVYSDKSACPECGSDLSDYGTASFCPACGNEL